MIPHAHVSHGMPCRLRIKVPSKKGDLSYFAEVQEQLSACPGVQDVTVSPYTGGAVILYDCDERTVAEYAREKGLFTLGHPARLKKKTLFDHVADTFGTYNKSLKKLTDGQVDVPSLVFLSLVISGIYQIARGNLSSPAWYTAFYYAVGVFSRARVDEWDEAEEFPEDFDDGDGE
jgi:hypothetical protein